jgi:ubiquinone/menaquinone biosynthesis C-methylase UbiE
MDRKSHWNTVYGTKLPEQVSWYQRHATLSEALIREVVVDRSARILDVGGGASTLVDDLTRAGYRAVTVLDVSFNGLSHARRRMGPESDQASWVVADVLNLPVAAASIALWHDRAVFHFLTELSDRARYVREVRRVVRPGGLVLVATFAADGPERCSGLPVVRYSPDELHGAFGEGFELVRSRREVHHTPSGGIQPFTYCLCRYRGSGDDGVTA